MPLFWSEMYCRKNSGEKAFEERLGKKHGNQLKSVILVIDYDDLHYRVVKEMEILYKFMRVITGTKI